MADYAFRTIGDRVEIQKMWEKGYSPKKIAEDTGKSLAVVYTELSRGRDGTRLPDQRLRYSAEQGYTVSCHDTKKTGRTINTAGHMTFTWEEAVEFCQQIAAGEVDLETMRAKFAADDAAKERTAIRRSIEEAKRFQEELEKAGISYRMLLHLTALQQEMDGLAHNILLGFERGEGWPDGT